MAEAEAGFANLTLGHRWPPGA